MSAAHQWMADELMGLLEDRPSMAAAEFALRFTNFAARWLAIPEGDQQEIARLIVIS